MGVVEFSVLGAVQKFRSLIAGPTPPAASAAEGEEVTRQTSGPPSPATPTRSRSGAADTTPPLPARPGGGRRAIALRRQISSPQLLRCHAVRRGDGEDDDEPGVQFFTPGNDYLHDFSDTDSLSVSTPNGVARSLTPSPLDSPTWMVGHNDASPTSKRNERLSLDSLGCDTRLNGGIADRSGGDMTRYPADFDANVWLPPSPEDEGDDVEARLFGFDYEDDEAGDRKSVV